MSWRPSPSVAAGGRPSRGWRLPRGHQALGRAITAAGVLLLGVALAVPPVAIASAAPTTASAGRPAAAKAKARPSVALSGGPRLVVNVDPNLSGGRYWRLRLDRRSHGKWRVVGVYRTKGAHETRTFKVKAGRYRVHVYARSGYRSVTSGAYAYSPSASWSAPGTPAHATSWWVPPKGTDWQWQLSGTVDTSVNASVFDIDGETNGATTVAALHAKGARVICYLSAGSFEKGRSDASSFPSSVLGNALEDWPDERWLDVRALDVLLPIMERRVAACKDKGFDAIEPDNVDGYANASGFPLTSADQIAYNEAIAGLAHRYGLGVGLKNDPGQVAALQPSFDFAVVEECARYGECSSYAPFSQVGKAVLAVEYSGEPSSFCPTTSALGFSGMLKNLSLDAWRSVCP